MCNFMDGYSRGTMAVKLSILRDFMRSGKYSFRVACEKLKIDQGMIEDAIESCAETFADGAVEREMNGWTEREAVEHFEKMVRHIIDQRGDDDDDEQGDNN